MPRAAILVVAGAVLVLVLTALLLVAGRSPRNATISAGDGSHLASYGFDLDGLLVPRDALAPAGIPRDGIPALTTPRLFDAREADAAPLGEHGHFLVPSDMVIGVVRNGAARCYPLRVMNWHEVVNDTLGGEPLCVTFNPPSFGIAAFDPRTVTAAMAAADSSSSGWRTIGGGHAREFGVSGLLYQSNLVLYGRTRTTDPGSRPALWSQLLGKAISGPEAGRELPLLPVVLTTWGAWRERHPATTVLAGDARKSRDYERDPFSSYFSSDEVRFATSPLPPNHDLPWKTVLRIEDSAGGGLEVIRLPEIRVLREAPREALGITDASDVIPARYAFHFVWYAMSRQGAHPREEPEPALLSAPRTRR